MKEKLHDKNKWLWKASPFLWAVLFSLNVSAQSLTVSGTVTTQTDGSSLPGVNVVLKGTTIGTVTDVNGSYSLNVDNKESVLVFSSVGYVSEEITVGGQTVINVALSEDIQALQEIVVIGYGTQKKSDLTGSVGQVKGEDISKYTYSDATQALQGRMAGVRVESNGGAPGANTIVTIRGQGTLSDNGPLYVIDGMLTGSMDMINPSDIESISVLKDASASAIYGSRAANGVVIVTTKKGTEGTPRINVDVNYGVQKAAKTIDWANNRQYADIVNRAMDNDGNARWPANDSQFNPNNGNDMQGETLRTAPIFNADVRVSGGTEKATYSISLSHLNQDGVVKQSSFQRTNLRANSSFTLGRFKFEETIGLTRTVDNPNNYFNREREQLPTINLYDADGNFSGSDAPEGVAFGSFYGVGSMNNSLGLATLEDRTVTRNTALGNLAASFEIVEGLTYKLNFGFEAYANNNYKFTPTYFFNPTAQGNKTFAELNETNTNYLSTLVENTLNYNRTFDKHSIDVVAGYSQQISNSRSLGAVARNFPNNDIRVASAAEDRAQMPSQDLTKAIQSYFGRVNYSFDDRYLLTATVRRDGSSLFKEGLRWGTFPSFAAGWNLSNESFMSNFSLLTDMKIRASYGEVGSDNVPIYAISPELNLFSEYPLGTTQQRATGYSITKGVNPNIFWETSKTTDIGVEFNTLQRKLNISMDYFVKNSEDVLVELALPLYTGFGNRVPFNTASIKNSGFEFIGTYSQSVGDFTYSVGANFSILHNEVTALGDATPIIEGQFTSNGLKSTKTDVGHPVGSFYGYIVDGIYQSDEEADQANDANSPQAGDMKFRDINGPDGTGPDGAIDVYDQTYIGNPAPNFIYGINFSGEYKKFDINLFFNGVAGNDILNANRYRGYFDTEGNYLADALNAWTPENTDTDIPRNTWSDPGFNRRTSDFYLESGAYFRLRNMQIGYTFLENTKAFQRMRVYLSGQNVFTFTKYKGYYPEVGRNTRGSRRIFNAGVDENAYPTARTYQLGLQVTF